MLWLKARLLQSKTAVERASLPITRLMTSLVPQRIDRVHPRRAPRGEKARHDAGQNGNQQRNPRDGQGQGCRQKLPDQKGHRPGDRQRQQTAQQTNARRLD